MAFVALSPIRNAHWVISGEMPILANTGTKMKDMKAHLAVADTIKIDQRRKKNEENQYP